MRYRCLILSIAIISIATIFAFVDVSAAKHELLGQPLPEFTQQRSRGLAEQLSIEARGA
jgi:hypothetical protein